MKDKIRCYCEVDELYGDIEVAGYGRKSWEIDVRGEARNCAFVSTLIGLLYEYLHVAAVETIETIRAFCRLSKMLYGSSTSCGVF